MERKDEELLKRLLPMFKIEAQDHLRVISSGLIEMEKSSPEKRAELIEVIFRESHSLKGAARSVNAVHVMAICQSLENIFSALKRRAIDSTPALLDLLHESVDCTAGMVAGGDGLSFSQSAVGALVQKLENAIRPRESAPPAGKKQAEPVACIPSYEIAVKPPHMAEAHPVKVSVFPEPVAPPPNAAPSDTVRISIDRLDSLLLQAEELLAIKITGGQRVEELRELQKSVTRWKKDRARKKSSIQRKRPERRSEKSDRDEFDSFASELETRLTTLVRSAEYDQRSFSGLVDNLLEDAKKALMFPLRSLLEVFPKLVRDISKEVGKEVDFFTSGTEVELDRRVLEEIKDPLVHLVRNCIDHGIESPGDRKRKNKPPRGKIAVSVSSRDGKIEIAVSDDGAGIDPIGIRKAAERSGAISSEELERLGEGEALPLIFRSGVTTSPVITDISGRGLGLAIVRERVEKLDGSLAIETQPDSGTTIRMQVPLTLATFRGVLVRVGDNPFFFPAPNIERVARFRKEEIQSAGNRQTVSLEGRPVSLAKLADVLELHIAGAPREEAPHVQIVFLRSAGQRIAFQVDEIIQEQEILVKNLGPQLTRVRNVAGAALLANGKVVPILNARDLMVSAEKKTSSYTVAAADEPAKRVSVLVVEDSITARALLRTILESAGYTVATAVDGMDALDALKSGDFDLVVSDIEMPRMSGFDLTAKIRSDKRLSEIPVVLVTALESREDRERGIDVGANAYIIKSSFEHSNLLDVIRRLV